MLPSPLGARGNCVRRPPANESVFLSALNLEMTSSMSVSLALGPIRPSRASLFLAALFSAAFTLPLGPIGLNCCAAATLPRSSLMSVSSTNRPPPRVFAASSLRLSLPTLEVSSAALVAARFSARSSLRILSSSSTFLAPGTGIPSLLKDPVLPYLAKGGLTLPTASNSGPRPDLSKLTPAP